MAVRPGERLMRIWGELMRIWGDLTTAIPVHVTRQTADGYTGSLTLSVWMQLLILLLVWLNAVAWGLIGLYEAARVVLG